MKGRIDRFIDSHAMLIGYILGVISGFAAGLDFAMKHTK